MRISILGAGSIGLHLGAQLARAGLDPLLVVRRAETASLLDREGLHVVDPTTDRRWSVPIRTSVGMAEAGRALREGPVLLCVRAPDTAAASEELHGVARDPHVVSAQNDVDNEAILARRFARVSGLVVRQTATRMAPNVVHAAGGGRLAIGDFPRGVGANTRDLAAALERAGFDVGTSERIEDDKWLKLCINLMTSVNAIVRRDDHEAPAFAEVKTRLLEEARDALAAAGIAARSCDGRDRSLDGEIAYQRSASERGGGGRPIALYNGVWTALSHENLALEADLYHRRILELAKAHGTAAPVNRRVLDVLVDVWRRRAGPESVRARTLLPR